MYIDMKFTKSRVDVKVRQGFEIAKRLGLDKILG